MVSEARAIGTGSAIPVPKVRCYRSKSRRLIMRRADYGQDQAAEVCWIKPRADLPLGAVNLTEAFHKVAYTKNVQSDLRGVCRGLLSDPRLVEQRPVYRLLLVVPCASGDKDHGTLAEDGDHRRLVDYQAVQLRPCPASGCRVGHLQRLRLAGQLVRVRVAVPADVEGSVRIHLVQGPAAEHRDEVVGHRRDVGSEAKHARLGRAVRTEDRLRGPFRGDVAQCCTVAKLPQ